jgi:acid stress-induced BolA-like protein IbaG/YrbA
MNNTSNNLNTLPSTDDIAQYIRAKMLCSHIEIEGDGRHFFATIVSDSFIGVRTIARQRAVYAALGDKILGADAHIHALSMKTYTPDEWAALQA